MPTKKALYVAAQCWCDPRVSDRTMDSDMAVVFAEVIDEYIGALQWCSGSDDFAIGGKARVGWDKITLPLLDPEISIDLDARDEEEPVEKDLVIKDLDGSPLLAIGNFNIKGTQSGRAPAGPPPPSAEQDLGKR